MKDKITLQELTDWANKFQISELEKVAKAMYEARMAGFQYFFGVMKKELGIESEGTK